MKHLLQRTWWRAMRRFGLHGSIALALLVPAAAIALWLPRLDQRADELRSAMATQTAVVARMGDRTRRPLLAGEQVSEFVSAFPPLSQSASDLSALFAIARRRNVSLPKGEYQLKAEPHTSLVAYQATFPVHGGYGTLKAFTADALEAMPHASLDELRMVRTDAGQVVLDATVRITFVYRSQ